MPKSSNQKYKIIYILKLLTEQTDEEHVVSTKDIIDYLESCDIHAERKSIYSDIEALNYLGYDIIYQKEQPSGYYMASRDFELAELTLLVDAVQAAKFITPRKSAQLISKLESLTSRFEAQQLQRQVYVSERVKTENESIFYNVDYLHKAITKKQSVTFHYCEWNMEKKLIQKKNGAVYIVEPYAMTIDDSNYYLVGYDTQDNKIKHFRVDKMQDIELTGVQCTTSNNSTFNIAQYTRKHFGMFSGEEEMVRVRFDKSLTGVVIDRFGTEVTIINKDENSFEARLNVNVSDQFFGWLCSFHGKAVIISPEQIREQYTAFIADNLAKAQG